MVTIIDVAKAAGVSPSTVSHVLNGKRPISDATKKRVHDAIVALGYEPNPNAQALRSTSSGIIAFYASDITEVFSTLIIQGAERICRENNYYMIFASGVEFNNDIAEAMHFLKRRRIDGLIVSFGIRKRIENRLPKALDFPVVSINARVSDDIPSIQPDDYSGGREAARYLLQRGAKNPAIIGGLDFRSNICQLDDVRRIIARDELSKPSEQVIVGNSIHLDCHAGMGSGIFRCLFVQKLQL